MLDKVELSDGIVASHLDLREQPNKITGVGDTLIGEKLFNDFGICTTSFAVATLDSLKSAIALKHRGVDVRDIDFWDDGIYDFVLQQNT